MWKNILPTITLFFFTAILTAQKPVLVIPTGHSSGVHSFDCSANGKFFLTVGGDELIKLWSKEGKELRTYRSSLTRRYQQAKLSPDAGKMLVTRFSDFTEAWVLDVGSGKELFELRGHRAPLTDMDYSPDGRLIATASQDSTVFIWNAVGGWSLHVLRGQASMKQVAFSPDGKLLATSSEDKTIKIWDVASGALLRNISVAVESFSGRHLAFSADGKMLTVGIGFGEKGIGIWEVETGELRFLLDGYAAFFSPDGEFLCRLHYNKAFIHRLNDLYGPPIKVINATLPFKGGPMVIGLLDGRFLPDGKHILLCATTAPEIHDFRTGALSFSLDGYALPVQNASYSPDGTRCIVGTAHDLIEWDFSKGYPIKLLKGHTENVGAAEYSPDGRHIISVARDYTFQKWDAQNGQNLQKIMGEYTVYPIMRYSSVLAIAPDGAYFVKGYSPGFKTNAPILKSWNIQSGEVRDSFSTNTEESFYMRDLAISPDGKSIACSNDSSILFWNVQSQQIEDQIAAHGLYSFAFSPDGVLIAWGSVFGNLQVLDIKQRKVLFTHSIGHEQTVIHGFLSGFADYDRVLINDIAFSPDGKWLATASSDKTLRVFDTQTQELRYRLEGHDNSVDHVDFSPHSLWLISASSDNTLRIWDLQSGLEAAKIIHLKNGNWVVTTPAGLFDASPGAMRLMYFLCGDEVIELDQLKDRYYEPGLLPKLLGFAQGGLRPVDELNNVPLYPEFLEANIQNDTLRVRLKPRNGGIGRVALLRAKDQELVIDANPQRKTDFEIDLKPYASQIFNNLYLRFYNQEGWLKSQLYPLEYSPDGVGEKGPGERKSLNKSEDAKLEEIHFYALVVGTSKFRGTQLNLKYPDLDAASFADALQQAGNQLFSKDRTHVRLLSTETEPWPRKAEIRNALIDIDAKATIKDILLIYFSGHGITYPPNSEKGQFYYLTTDIAGDKLDDPAVLNAQAIGLDSLMEWVRPIDASKRILILDACNSGSAVENLEPGAKELNSDQRRALERANDRSGMFVLAGSAADKSSYEASSYGHGLLTYSLLNGMMAVAAKKDKNVELGDLFAYVEDDVPVLAKNINRVQKPEVIKAESYPIGRIDENVRIKMPTERSVFVRVSMMDVKKNKDLLGLTKTLNAELERVATEKNSSLVFWDVESYAGKYYYLGGQYESTEGSVKGNASLYLNDTELTKFPISGSVDALSKLAKDLIFDVQEYLAKNAGK